MLIRWVVKTILNYCIFIQSRPSNSITFLHVYYVFRIQWCMFSPIDARLIWIINIFKLGNYDSVELLHSLIYFTGKTR